MKGQNMTAPNGGQGGGPAKGAAAVAPRPYPFPVGVYESGVQDYDNQVTQVATPLQMPLWNISPTGWMRGLWFDFTWTTAANAATVVFNADPTAGGFAGVQKVILYDLGGETVFSLAGFEWLVSNKYGGYFEVGDPRADLTFTQTAGVGAGLGGSQHFILYLPLEAVARDGLGTVQNESKPGWKVELWIDSSAQTYTTPPTTLGTVRVRGFVDSYTEPAAAAPNGRPFAQTPPLPGTLQYWKSENQALPSGNAKYDLTNGIGFPIRNIIYYTRDTSNSTRATADVNWPDPATVLLGNINYMTRSKNLWISKMSKAYGFNIVGATTPAADAAMGRDNALFPVWLTQDMGLRPGQELRFKYLDTQVNSLIRITGTFGAASTLFALVNWLATPTKNRYSLISGSGA
jgi:hypothetical protein